MDSAEYVVRGKYIVDKTAEYLKAMADPNWICDSEHRVHPVVTTGDRKTDIEPGCLAKRIPREAPQEGEKWDDIIKDAYEHIMTGVLHWQSPHMHAYFPGNNSCPSLLGEMLEDAIGSLSFSWASSPACTELEIIVCDWLVKILGLPDFFQHSHPNSRGGGCIQSTTSESTLMAMLAARSEAVKLYKAKYPDVEEAVINGKLVAYCSDQAHSSVQKAAQMVLLDVADHKTSQLRQITPKGDDLSLTGKELEEQMEQDRQNGLIPFFVCATLGSTGVCAIDKLEEMGRACRKVEETAKHDLDQDAPISIWLHVDAAYGGNFFVLEDQRHHLKGIEHAQSIVTNIIKGLMVHMDCSCLWVKDSRALYRIFNDDPLYMAEEISGAAVDFKHWHIAFSRRFRALKLWFVLRSFGVKGLKEHKQNDVAMANKIVSLMRKDSRFEIAFPPAGMGLICFRLKPEQKMDEMEDKHFQQTFMNRINNTGQMYLIPTEMKEKYVIRFVISSQYTTAKHIEIDWECIKKAATEHLKAYTSPKGAMSESAISLVGNPYRQQFINASFATMFDDKSIVMDHHNKMSEHQERAKSAAQQKVTPAALKLRASAQQLNGSGPRLCRKCK